MENVTQERCFIPDSTLNQSKLLWTHGRQQWTHSSHLTSPESVTGDNFEQLTAAESANKTPQSQKQALLDRCDSLENRSGRSNLCIENIPEDGEDLQWFHKVYVRCTDGSNGPWCFLKLKYQATTVRVCQDVNATLAKKRTALNKPCIRRTLYSTCSTWSRCKWCLEMTCSPSIHLLRSTVQNTFVALQYLNVFTQLCACVPTCLAVVMLLNHFCFHLTVKMF